MAKKKVLVFPCGTEVALEINRSLKNSIHFEMYGASSMSDHGEYVFKNYIPNVPHVENKDFISVLKQICEKYEIDFIFPAHDSVVLKLAKYAHEFKAEVITSCFETNEICRSKLKTYESLRGIVSVPKVFNREEVSQYPVFLKPIVGQGAKGTHKVSNRSELDFYLDRESDLLILEYLPGKEYTIDCFTNRHGKLLFVHGRQRARISNGISVDSKPVKDKRFIELAEKINSTLRFRGVWFFQVKENSQGEFVLMEIAPRIAGTMGLCLGSGVNLAQLSLFDRMGYDVDVIKNQFDIEIDRALVACYKTDLRFETVYIDFDDLILLENGVNPEAIALLYQFKNHGKKLVLITKHDKDIYETLAEHNIEQKLFDKIIQIAKSEEKKNYIMDTNAIFIDDSFYERQQVSKYIGIPVFGVENLNVLKDWRG